MQKNMQFGTDCAEGVRSYGISRSTENLIVHRCPFYLASQGRSLSPSIEDIETEIESLQ